MVKICMFVVLNCWVVFILVVLIVNEYDGGLRGIVCVIVMIFVFGVILNIEGSLVIVYLDFVLGFILLFLVEVIMMKVLGGVLG